MKLHWPLGRSLSRLKCTSLHAKSVQPYITVFNAINHICNNISMILA